MNQVETWNWFFVYIIFRCSPALTLKIKPAPCSLFKVERPFFYCCCCWYFSPSIDLFVPLSQMCSSCAFIPSLSAEWSLYCPNTNREFAHFLFNVMFNNSCSYVVTVGQFLLFRETPRMLWWSWRSATAEQWTVKNLNPLEKLNNDPCRFGLWDIEAYQAEIWIK